MEAETSALLGSDATSYSHTFRIVRPDGTIRFILDRGVIRRDADGRAQVLSGINIDVTDLPQIDPRAISRNTGIGIPEEVEEGVAPGARADKGAAPARTSGKAGDPNESGSAGVQPEFPEVAAVARIGAVPKILEVVCRTTGMGFAAVARVTEDRWIACAVRDEIAFGLEPGGELEVRTTICNEIRQSGQLVVIDHVAEDPRFCRHPAPERYGFQSYISVPILRADGTLFGTLCAIDPRPLPVSRPKIMSMFTLFAELIASHLDAQDQLERAEAMARQLRESEERQRLALEGADLGAWDVDPRTGAAFWNRRHAELQGYLPEGGPATTERWRERVHPDDLERVMAEIERVQRTREPLSVEHRLRRADTGEVRWLSVYGRFFYDESGKAMRFSGVSRDVTEHKQAEERLQERDEQLRLAMDAANAGRWKVNLATGEFFASDRALALHGLLPGTPMTHERALACVHPDDRAMVELALQRAVEAGEPFRLELRAPQLDGSIRWLASHAERLSGGGEPCLVGLVQDITERKEAEERLRQSEERYRGIFERAGTGIAITSLDSRCESCNPAFAAMLGYSEDELRGRAFGELIHPDDRTSNMAEAGRLLAGDIPSFEIVNRYLRKNGTPLWVHKRVSLLRDPGGQPSHFIVLATDMTSQRAYQEKIETLMREVNHRSKNMLALVYAVARQTASAGADDFLERFGDRVQALAASQDLLVQTDWEGADLAALIESQLLHFKDLVGRRIILGGPRVELAPRAAQTLGMALHELATNAAKYGALSNEEGSVEISWQILQDRGGPHLAIDWTEENGPPVAPPNKLGFGQRVAKSLVESALGAQVTLDYAETGVRWTLRCPLSAIEMSKLTPGGAAAPVRQAPSTRHAPTASAVLIVEDDAVLALELAEDLQAAGFDIIGPAASVAQAVDLLQEREPAFAVLDVNLSGETSEPIAQRLQDKNIPFVSVSGYLRSQQSAIFQEGPFLSKPVHMPSLLKELERANITATG